MELHGFYNDKTLKDFLQNKDITFLQYMYHHEQRRHDFESFCARNCMQVDERAAAKYFDYLLKSEEDSHVDGLD